MELKNPECIYLARLNLTGAQVSQDLQFATMYLKSEQELLEVWAQVKDQGSSERKFLAAAAILYSGLDLEMVN